MTTSDGPTEAFVWVWLPGSGEPVVAGRLEQDGPAVVFNYGRSFLGRDDAMPLYLPEVPLRPGRLPPGAGLTVAGCFADAAPDAWGQRVILRRRLGDATNDPAALGVLSYLLLSGSDRIGALDFQASPEAYVARGDGGASLDELVRAADRVEAGVPFSPALDQALVHGSSVGGARPKALLRDGDRSLIAKFSSSTDPYAVVKGEFAAMDLARVAGLRVAPVELTSALGRDVLLIERFDRPGDSGQRRAVVSALTMLGLDELLARYASYVDLAQVIRERFVDARATLRELFARIAFNVLVGNNDDHARNHAAFWDGRSLELTPAYDLCPQPRAGGETTQAMAFGADGYRMSTLSGVADAAPFYMLGPAEAREIIDHQIDAIRDGWPDIADRARMTEVERSYFWGRQFLNPYALRGY